jgi:hypothetical protein
MLRCTHSPDRGDAGKEIITIPLGTLTCNVWLVKPTEPATRTFPVPASMLFAFRARK